MGVTHLSSLEVAGVPTMGMGGAPMFTGNWYFVDPAHGSDGNTGAADSPLATLYRAYALARSGYNDVIVLVGDGSTTGTARMSVALAQTVDASATTGTITWAKNALHLIGQTAPTAVNGRARIAPPTGTYTASTFGNNGNMFNVTGTGCYFGNFSLFNGFSTGSTTQIAWKEAGGRNYYNNVWLGGMADAESAGAAGARTIKITSSENTFDGCNFGLDTITRTAANANIEFASACTRNTFRNCVTPFMTSASTPLGILITGASAIDRWTLFDHCLWINNIKSTSTTMTVLASMTSASPGGLILMKDNTLVGISKFGDTNALANSYVDGGAPDAATTGLAVNPS